MKKISSNAAALVWSEKEAHEKMKKFSSILTHCMKQKKAIRFIFALETQEMKREKKKIKLKFQAKIKKIRNKFNGQF